MSMASDDARSLKVRLVKLKGRLIKRIKADAVRTRLAVALLVVPFMGLYGIANRLNAARGSTLVFQFPIDDRIPFIPVFILPYFAWYFYVAAVLLWLAFDKKTGQLLYRQVLAICLSETIAFVIFLVFPTFMPRPDVVGQDVLSLLVRLIYRSDFPYNCFPSLHVCLAALTAWVLELAGPKHLLFRLANLAMLLLITLSTVLTKQHLSPDIPGGLLLAGLCWLLSGQIIRLVRQVSERGRYADPVEKN